MERKKVAFWGMGRRMQAVWELFEADMDFIVTFIDTRKAGDYFLGREIMSYSQTANDNDMLVILNSMYREEILDEISKHQGKERIFDLDKYLAD